MNENKMTLNQPTIKLDVWKGDWGLPSTDVESLRFLACIRFSGAEYEVTKKNNPFWTPKGTLPVVHYGKEEVFDFQGLQNLLKHKNISPDEGLSKKELAEAEAYTNMLKDKLHPAFLYTWWLDEKNYTLFTRPWFAKTLPFPFNFVYPRRYWHNANSLIQALFESLGTQANIESIVYSDAEKCLTALSTRLGGSEFMFGAHPTSIDATLYAFLAPLLKAPLKNTILQNHLKNCHNLHKFVIRISQRYFPKDSQDFEEQKRKTEETVNNNCDSEFPHKRRNQFFATVFALFAMTTYALATGIVQSPYGWPFQKLKPADPVKIRLSLLWDWKKMMQSEQNNSNLR